MAPTLKLNNLTTGIKISDQLVNDKIKGAVAVGILGDGINVQKALDQFTLTEVQNTEVFDGVSNTFTTYDVKLSGIPVKVFLVGSVDVSSNFPFEGKLIGNMPNQLDRLIQLMEENGCASYKIIKK